ncbi:hypothetical protein [Lentzea atacamensis]|uniref:hypothetical protein n=1 Tax=Lentzea atacamensis TaxID=531938 RepID=UPI001C00AEA6|nr:hypothetical protein [Lentzea atacamensis]
MLIALLAAAVLAVALRPAGEPEESAQEPDDRRGGDRSVAENQPAYSEKALPRQ